MIKISDVYKIEKSKKYVNNVMIQPGCHLQENILKNAKRN